MGVEVETRKGGQTDLFLLMKKLNFVLRIYHNVPF